MAIKKELFINSLDLIEIDDRTNIPTVVLFEPGRISIGYEALDRATDPIDVSDNFKLELGKVRPGRLDPPRFDTADGRQRSSNEITKDFLEYLLRKVDAWVSARGLVKAARILVAEPLTLDRSDQVGQDWLANYRQRLKAILSPYFKEVDFLPEPFAVFQYYRYGLRHMLLAAATKHVALVIDFGGGTFDVCVVETAASGDVSASGRNSKPLAAASIPVGGKFVNDAIVRDLITSNLQKGVDKALLSKAWTAYDAHSSDISRDFQSLRNDFKQFIRNVRCLAGEVERGKMYICNAISDWSLDAEYRPSPACQLLVPTDPLAADPKPVSVRFDAYQLRELFVTRIWKKELKPAICHAVSRARSELDGRPITAVLLSGGSSNIRWLARLIDLEILQSLPHAQVLELQESFQEVVAKGLAVECARKTFSEGTGDFKSVTYNRLCFVVAPDGGHPTPRRYRFMGDPGFISNEVDGVLLPAAKAIGQFIDKPLRWKFRLASPPKKQLDYYFLKSSLDFEDVYSVHNVEHRVFTPPNTHFDSTIQLELTLSEDGTANPTFIYRQGRDGKDAVTVSGTPFFMDMTSGAETTMGDAYIGLDFGTSNSAVCYVEQGAIRVFSQRAGEKGWLELNELANRLPYPVANPIGRFVASTTARDLEERFAQAFESLLHFAASVAYCDYRATKGAKQTRIFKSFTKSSAGPLWALLKQVIEGRSRDSIFCARLSPLLEHAVLIDSSIDAINDRKHYRASRNVDYQRVIGLLGNLVGGAFMNWHFGGFEGVTKKGFSGRHVGLLRIAHGSHSPFLDVLTYEGSDAFSELEAVAVNVEEGTALRLAPLMYWTPRDARGESSVAVLDSCSSTAASYRMVEFGGHVEIDADSEFSELYSMCLEIRESDKAFPEGRCKGLKLVER